MISRLAPILFLLFFLQHHISNAQINLREELMTYTEINVHWNQAGEIQKELNDGLNNLHEGKFSVAANNFSRVIELDSSLAYARYYKAIALKSFGQPQAALNELKTLVEEGSGFFEAFIEQSKILILIQKLNESKEILKIAKRVQPSSALPDYLQGIVHLCVSDFSGSLPFFQKSLQIDSGFFQAKNKLAFSMYQLNQQKEALKLLNDVIRKQNKNIEALAIRGRIYSSHLPGVAILDLNKVLVLSPGDYSSRVLRGVMHTKLKNYPLAFADFQKVLNENPINEGFFKGEETPLDEAFDLQSIGYELMANMYGLPAEDLEKVKTAYCLLFVREFQEARLIMEAVVKKNSQAFCLLLLGLAYERAGDHGNALKTYEKTINLGDATWVAHKKVAIYKSSQGNWLESEKEFSKAIDLKPDFFSLYKLRGITRYMLSRYVGAESDFDRYLAIDSVDKQAINNRSEVYAQQKRFKLAVRDYFKANDTARLNSYQFEKVKRVSDWMLATGDTIQAVDFVHRFFLKTWSKEANDWKFVILLSQQNKDLMLTHFKHFQSFANRPQKLYLPEQTWLLTAASYSMLGDYEDAKVFFEKAMDVNRYNPWFYYYRAKLAAKLGRVRDAIKDLKLADELGMIEAQNELKRIRSRQGK